MARRERDQYFTPEFATRELLKRVPISGAVLECCHGDAAITSVVECHPATEYVWTNDIDPSLMADFHYDVSLAEAWPCFGDIDWVVTNPPFSHAPLIVPLAFNHAKIGIAMLLRKTYTEPCRNRQDWLLSHKEYFSNQIFLPRISFTGDGRSDNVACDWYVWTKEKVSGCKVDWVMKP